MQKSELVDVRGLMKTVGDDSRVVMDYINLSSAARFLGRSREAIRRRVIRGSMRHVMVNGEKFVAIADVMTELYARKLNDPRQLSLLFAAGGVGAGDRRGRGPRPCPASGKVPRRS